LEAKDNFTEVFQNHTTNPPFGVGANNLKSNMQTQRLRARYCEIKASVENGSTRGMLDIWKRAGGLEKGLREEAGRMTDMRTPFHGRRMPVK